MPRHFLHRIVMGLGGLVYLFIRKNAVPLNSVGAVLRLLGRMVVTVFFVGQVVFLLSANFLEVEKPLREWFKDRHWHDKSADEAPDYLNGKGDVQERFEVVRAYDKRWGELTSQPQSWGLFSPYIGKVLTFPAVELRWDAEDWPNWADQPVVLNDHSAPVVVLSDNEPTQRGHYFRFGHLRVRKYEEQITPYPPSSDDGSFNPETEIWKEKIRNKVCLTRDDREPDCIYNYLHWRLEVYQSAHADQPRPTQVILLVRAYQVPKPPGPEPWDWHDMGQHRVARWLPSAPLNPEKFYPVESYDPLDHHFSREEK
jgi:hypothetical protein